ncbi:hypothetical protein GCM10023231_37750 [Olivibacter ginsenosidimutans]|uniref:BD-FAE-like domain-containing protein n=1 Tax=Olivibacter ginsenosidimutans TaxID=1176537 RepID=A0ABP9C8C7_9SPHI
MTPKFFSTIVLVMTTLVLAAQQPSTSFEPIYPEGKIPNVKSSKINVKEVSKVGEDGIERVSGVSIPAMRYYPPNPDKFTGSALVICPGGGYAILAMSHEGDDVAKQFAEQGIAAFVLKYRLPNELIMEDKSIGPLQDAQQALKLVREHASTYGIQPNKIGIIGFSAGGHLASSAGVHYQDIKIENSAHTSLRPDFMLLLYPVISMDTAITHMGSRENLLGKHPADALVNYFSNEKQVTQDTPPTLLVQAEDDTTVPLANSQRFYDALQKNNIPSKLITYPHGGHGFGLNNKTTDDKWFDHAIEWLHEQGY